MKLKISFDKKAVLRFFIDHIEKVVMAIFIIIVAAILYGAAWNREKFDKSPAQLNTKCNDAKNVMAGERPESIKDLKYNDYSKTIEKFNPKTGVSVLPYECNVAWDQPVFGIKAKRSQPFNITEENPKDKNKPIKTLLGVEGLRATAEFGAFQVNATLAADAAAPVRPGQGGRGGRAAAQGVFAQIGAVRGKCWVVLTGLTPVEEHISAFKKAFRDAVGYDQINDMPVYMGYYVERAEIQSPADLQEPKWISFNSAEAEKEAMKEWQQQQQDVVAEKYIDPSLAFPLGPLQNRSWGKNAAYEPEIPIRAALFGDEGAAAMDANAADKPADGSPFEERARNPAEAVDGGGRGGGRFNRPAMGRTAAGAEADFDSPAKYLLLRYFDFAVEPGKSYIYRVRLVLKNPNFEQEPNKLENPDLAKERYLFTAWSKPTGVIFVPSDTQILADTVKPKTQGDPTGSVYLLKWLKSTGQEVQHALSTIERGQVLNYKDVKPKPVRAEGFGTTPEVEENTDFLSDATILDMDGGKKLIGKEKLTEPGEMLFMLVRGKSPVLMLRNELDDMPEVQRISVEPDATRMQERGGFRGQAPGRGEEELLRGEEPPPTRGRPGRNPRQ